MLIRRPKIPAARRPRVTTRRHCTAAPAAPLTTGARTASQPVSAILDSTEQEESLSAKRSEAKQALHSVPIKRSTEDFLNKMKMKPMAGEGKFYPFLRLPTQLTDFRPWLNKHNKACNDWLVRYRTLKAARYNAPLATDARSWAIRRATRAKFKQATTMFTNNRLDLLSEQCSPWAADFVKGWKYHLDESDLYYRFYLHSIESSSLLGAALFVDYGGPFPDPVADGKISDWANGRYATAMLPTQVSTFPKEWYSLAPIDTIFQQNHRGQSDLVVWSRFVTRERFEVYSAADGSQIFSQSGVNEHIWKFGRRLPKLDADKSSAAFQWKILDMDNQVLARANQIVREDHLFTDETQAARKAAWLQAIDE